VLENIVGIAEGRGNGLTSRLCCSQYNSSHRQIHINCERIWPMASHLSLLAAVCYRHINLTSRDPSFMSHIPELYRSNPLKPKLV
jgi:hypothetical protein